MMERVVDGILLLCCIRSQLQQAIERNGRYENRNNRGIEVVIATL